MKTVKGKKVLITVRCRDYSDMVLYTSPRAWLISEIWQMEMKSLDRKLAEENRKVLMILDSCPAHTEIELRNITFLFLLPGTTSHCQVRQSLK